MGHLLKTVNPEAAAAIQPIVTAPPEDLPVVGDVVLFIPRPGEGGGKTVIPMLITVIYSDGRRGGIAFRDANDYRDVPGVHQRTPDNPHHCWDFIRSDDALAALEPSGAAIGQLQTHIAGLEATISAQRMQLVAMRNELKNCLTSMQNIGMAVQRMEKEFGIGEPTSKPKPKK